MFTASLLCLFMMWCGVDHLTHLIESLALNHDAYLIWMARPCAAKHCCYELIWRSLGLAGIT